MRVLSLLLVLVPCAALAQEAEPPAAPAKEAAAATEGATATPAATAAPAPTAIATPAAIPAEPPATPAAVEAAGEAELPLPPPPPPAAAPYPRWGFFLGGGFPQAATLSLIFRPLPYLRLHAGPSWGYLKFGYHGGVTLAPVRWAVSPTLGFEAGRFASIDVTTVAKDGEAGVQDLLRNVDVTYAAALLGLELGSQRGFCFDLKVGLTWLKVDARGTGTFTGSGGTVGAGGSTNDATITVTNPTLRGTAPTVQLGFQYFF